VSRSIQALIDRLKTVDPENPKLAKLQRFELIYQGMLEDGWFRRTDEIAEDCNGMYDVISTTSPDTPNIVTYAIIWVGMHSGGWLRLTERQQDVIRSYIFKRISLYKIAEQYGVKYESVSESFFRGVENLRLYAINLIPSLADVFLSEDVRRKSSATKEYQDRCRERLAKVRETEAYTNRSFRGGPGRGHKGKRVTLVPLDTL
jgi:predicted DNA-binding protein YlxM (UPF0122 family)